MAHVVGRVSQRGLLPVVDLGLRAVVLRADPQLEAERPPPSVTAAPGAAGELAAEPRWPVEPQMTGAPRLARRCAGAERGDLSADPRGHPGAQLEWNPAASPARDGVEPATKLSKLGVRHRNRVAHHLPRPGSGRGSARPYDTQRQTPA